jgi:hypothetical protein
MDVMASDYYFIFNNNDFILVDEEKNVLLKERFRKKNLEFNGLSVSFKTTWFDSFLLRKRVEIRSDSVYERIIFKLKSFSGTWSFCYEGNECQFRLLRGYKSKIVSNGRTISSIDIFNAAKLGYKDKWAYVISCEKANYLVVILICILLFVAIEDIDGLMSPGKNLIGKHK